MELVKSAIVDACVKEGFSKDAVKGILNRHIEGRIEWKSISQIGVLGIDEISLKKGHKDYVTLITCRKDGVVCLLSVIKGREKAKIKMFLKSIPRKLKRTVEAVCTDMYDGYVNAAKEVFKKNTVVVIDRFHVSRLYRRELDSYRQKILAQLKKELSAREYEQLKGVMQILCKGNECSSKKEKAVNEINAWIKEVRRSNFPCFNKFVKTLRALDQRLVEQKKSRYLLRSLIQNKRWRIQG